MQRFKIVWAGQLISMIGSSLTRIALSIWIYQQTRSVSLLAVLLVASILPGVLVSPFAGALIDRWDKRSAMLFSDAFAALGPCAVVVLAAFDQAQLPFVCAAIAISSAATAFQAPALGALVTRLVPAESLNRANGYVQFAAAGSQVVAPMLGGVLLVQFGLSGVLLIDVATFLVSLVTLAAIGAAGDVRAQPGGTRVSSVLQDIATGFRYLGKQPGLIAVLAFLVSVNLFSSMGYTIFTPLLLGITSPQGFGIVLGIGGLGMVAGSITMITWRGPRRRVTAVIVCAALIGVGMVIVGVRPYLPLIAAGTFLMYFALPLAVGYDQAIWQTRCKAEIQGRMFAIRAMALTAVQPLAFAIAGPLADHWFTPLAQSSAGGTEWWTVIAGEGPGRGVALMMVLLGSIVIAVAVVGANSRRLLSVEQTAALPELAADVSVVQEV
jgi:DHA3 family macrolide efflux protein-like MFS transporter